MKRSMHAHTPLMRIKISQSLCCQPCLYPCQQLPGKVWSFVFYPVSVSGSARQSNAKWRPTNVSVPLFSPWEPSNISLFVWGASHWTLTCRCMWLIYRVYRARWCRRNWGSPVSFKGEYTYMTKSHADSLNQYLSLPSIGQILLELVSTEEIIMRWDVCR